MRKYTPDQRDALNYFADLYMNTMCDEDEACEMAEFMLGQCDGNAERLRGEAERYRDM